jgi:Glycogen debranching enzyme N terminal
MVDPRRTIRNENTSPEAPPEWLVANGLGGYASATIRGAITRRYHGFLVAAQPASLGRVVVLTEVDIEREDGSVMNLRENGRFLDFTSTCRREFDRAPLTYFSHLGSIDHTICSSCKFWHRLSTVTVKLLPVSG